MATGYDDASASVESDGPARGYGVSKQGELLELPEPGLRTVTVAGVRDPVARVLLDSPVPHLDRSFDYLVPAAIVRDLDLLRPIYRATSAYGHFGRPGFTWEVTDRVEALRQAI